MDPGAHTDRRRDRGADPRGRRGQLALTPPRAQTGGLRIVAGAIGLAATAAALAAAVPQPDGAAAHAPQTPYRWQLPRGFPIPAVPADNPMSEAKVALGERLFFEPRLSVSGRYSCASCHDPARSFSDGRAVATGATGEALPHNALALVNVAYEISFGWTKRTVRSLEAQMLEPLLNRHPIEIGLSGREAALSAELGADPVYAAAFAAAFPGEASPASFEHLVKAIAAFERTLISGRSPFDRYVFDGEHDALTREARRGMTLFFSARVGCSQCHSGFNFAGNWRDAQGETGPPSFASDGPGEEVVRVPTLRNVALTAPYMHDGRFTTLAAVLEHYSTVAVHPPARRASAHQGQSDRRLPREPLTATERAELIAFLESLTDESFVRRFTSAANAPPGTPPAH